jgi:hypothetical protein
MKSKRIFVRLNKKPVSLDKYTAEDIWGLVDTIAKFILPRLKAFRNHSKGYPHKAKGLQQWDKILDEMIFAFEHYANFDIEPRNRKDSIRIDRGLYLFYEYFEDLWI